jgi:cyclohexanone monooxygenase
MEIADMKQMHSVRCRAERVVKDAKTAEALKPWYQQFCKRPCFHDEYLKTFNRPNVTLVHDPMGIESFTEKGVVAGGEEHEVDCIIFATGFEIGYDLLDCGYPIIGEWAINRLNRLVRLSDHR